MIKSVLFMRTLRITIYACVLMGIDIIYVSAHEQVTASISSVGWRKESLNEVIEALLPQVDRINVFLQNYDSVPSFLMNSKITVARGEDYPHALALGACAKFFWAKNIQGYHIIADDDLIYPRNYVSLLIKKIEQYGRKAVVGFHGKIFHRQDNGTYKRILYHYIRSLANDTWVNLLGTGVMAYHSDTIKISLEDFVVRNHADMGFALIARRQGIPLVCIERPKKTVLRGKESRDPRAIWKDPNTAKVDMQMIEENSPWEILMP